MKKIFFSETIFLVVVMVSALPTFVLGQNDQYGLPISPTVHGRCVANCDTNESNSQPPYPNCQRGTHQEGDVCVPNVLDKSGHVVLPTPQSQKAVIKYVPTQFRNDIFNPTWWVTVPNRFINDVFNTYFWWVG